MIDKAPAEAYGDFLMARAAFKRQLTLVADCSNGPASLVMAELAKRFAAANPAIRVVAINDTIDPDFSAHGPDPSDPKALTDIAARIIAEKADLGIIFDGDGDRAVFVDERGRFVSPPAIAGFLAENVPGLHVADTLVYQALVHIDPALAPCLAESKVGRYFLNLSMRERGGVIGAEFSGHFYFKDFFGADSAAMTLMLILNFISAQNKPASAAFQRYESHIIVSTKATLKKPFNDYVAAIQADVAKSAPKKVSDSDGITADFGDSWVNMRPSNTEPIARVTSGAKSRAEAQALADRYVALLASD